MALGPNRPDFHRGVPVNKFKKQGAKETKDTASECQVPVVDNKANPLEPGTEPRPPIVNLDKTLTDSDPTSITEIPDTETIDDGEIELKLSEQGSGGVGLDITERTRFPAAHNDVFELETTTLEEAHYPKPRFWKDSDFKSATTHPDRLAYEIDVLITQRDNPQNLVSALEKLTLEGSTYRVRKTVARRLLKYAEPERSKILLARLAQACRLAVIENADSNESLLMTVSRSVKNLLIADHPTSVAKWMLENDCQNQLATFLSVIQPEDRAEILTSKVSLRNNDNVSLGRFLYFEHKQGLFQDMNEESLLSVLNVTGLSIVRDNAHYLIDLIKGLDTSGNRALTDQKYQIINKLAPEIIRRNPDDYVTLYTHLEERDSSFSEKKIRMIEVAAPFLITNNPNSFITIFNTLSFAQKNRVLGSKIFRPGNLMADSIAHLLVKKGKQDLVFSHLVSAETPEEKKGISELLSTLRPGLNHRSIASELAVTNMQKLKDVLDNLTAEVLASVLLANRAEFVKCLKENSESDYLYTCISRCKEDLFSVDDSMLWKIDDFISEASLEICRLINDDHSFFSNDQLASLFKTKIIDWPDQPYDVDSNLGNQFLQKHFDTFKVILKDRILPDYEHPKSSLQTAFSSLWNDNINTILESLLSEELFASVIQSPAINVRVELIKRRPSQFVDMLSRTDTSPKGVLNILLDRKIEFDFVGAGKYESSSTGYTVFQLLNQSNPELLKQIIKTKIPNLCDSVPGSEKQQVYAHFLARYCPEIIKDILLEQSSGSIESKTPSDINLKLVLSTVDNTDVSVAHMLVRNTFYAYDPNGSVSVAHMLVRNSLKAAGELIGSLTNLDDVNEILNLSYEGKSVIDYAYMNKKHAPATFLVEISKNFDSDAVYRLLSRPFNKSRTTTSTGLDILYNDFESFIKLISKLSTEQLDHFLNQSDIMTGFGRMVSDEKISKQLFEVLSLLTEQEQKNILETRLQNSGKSLACTIFEQRDTDDLLESNHYQILLSCDIEGESFVSYAVKTDKAKLASLIGWLPPADCLDLLKQTIEGVTIGQLLAEELTRNESFKTGAFLKELTEEDLLWILTLEIKPHSKNVILSFIEEGKSDLVKELLLKFDASNRGNVLNLLVGTSRCSVASELYLYFDDGEFLKIINGKGRGRAIRGDALISMLSSNYLDDELGLTNLVHAFIHNEPSEFNKLLDKLSIEDMKLLYQIEFENQTVGQWMAQDQVNDIFSQLEKLPTVDEKSDFLKIRLSNETSLFSTMKEAHPERLHEFVSNLGSNDKKARFLMSQIQDGADASVYRDIFNEFLDCFEGINGQLFNGINVESINKDELIRLITLSPTELTEEFKTVFERIGLSFEPDSLNSKGLSFVLLSEAKQNWLKGFLATLERPDLKIAIEYALEHGPETFITHLAKQLEGEFDEFVFQRNLESFIGDLIEITGNEGETKTISIILNQSRRDKAKRSKFLLEQYQRQLKALSDAPDSDDKTAKIDRLNEKIRKIEDDVRLEAGWQEKEFEGTKHTFFEAYSVEKKGEFKNGDLKDQSGIDKTSGEIETDSTISYYDKHARICESTRGVFKEGQHFWGEVRLYEKNKTYKAGFRRLSDGNMQCSDWVEEIGAEEYVVNFSKLLGWNGIQFGSNSNSAGEISSSSEELAYINSIYSEQPLVSKYSDDRKAFLKQITDLEGHFLSDQFKSKLPEIENYNTSIQAVFAKVRTIIKSAEDEGKKNSLKAFFESIAYRFSLDSTSEEMKNMACIQLFDQVGVCTPGFTATVQNIVSYLKSSNSILGTMAQLREHIITQEVWPKIQRASNRNISAGMFIHWQQALLLLANQYQISLASDVSAFNDEYAAAILTELRSNYLELFWNTYGDSYTSEKCVSYISGKIKDHVSDLLKGQLDEDLIVSIKKEWGEIELSEGQLESAKCTKLIEESEEMFEAILGEFLHNDVEIDQDFIRQFLSPLKIMLNNALDKVEEIDRAKYKSILIQIESERYSEDSIRNLIGLVRGEDKLLQKLYVKNGIVEELENQNTKINFDSLFRMAYIPKKFQCTVGAIETESAEYKGEPDSSSSEADVKEAREIALKQAFPDLIPMDMPSEEVGVKEKELLVFPKVETSGTAQYAYLRPNWTDAVETRVMRQLFEAEVLQEPLPVRRGFQFIG